MDRVPRESDDEQAFAMRALALQVAALLGLRLKLQLIRDGEAKLLLSQAELGRQVE